MNTQDLTLSSHTLADIRTFELSELDGVLYVELRPTDTATREVWSPKSLYVKDDLFAIVFSPGFYGASKRFDLYGECVYRGDLYKLLIFELEHINKSLRETENYSELLRYLSRKNTDYKAVGVLPEYCPHPIAQWAELREKLMSLTQEVLAFVRKCKAETKYLLVIGI